jgi:hypothetical protein
MAVARLAWVLPVLALVLAGCGSSDRFALHTPRPKVVPTVEGDGNAVLPGSSKPAAKARPVARAQKLVIRHWAKALRSGHVAQAADSFALPVIVANGTPPITLHKRRDILAFNRQLPCGAVVVGFSPLGRYVATTFRLVERPGAGKCGSGVGLLARTAFLIKHGHIARWVRLPDPQQAPSATTNAS